MQKMDFLHKLYECHALLSKELLLDREDKIILRAILRNFESCFSPSFSLVNSSHLLVDPLSYLLKSNVRPDLKTKATECVGVLFQDHPMKDTKMFINLTSLIFINIYEPQGSGVKYEASEELKSAVLRCGVQFIKSLQPDLILELYDINLANKISLPVLITVQIAEKEKSLKLRLDALQYLLEISQYNSDVPNIHKKVSDVFRKFLPGVMKPLQEILSRDETQQHAITVMTLTCWGHIMCAVMQDEENHLQTSDENLVRSWLNIRKASVVNINEALKHENKTEEWIKAVSTILKPLIVKTAALRNHSSYKVRLELVNVAAKLVHHCLTNLGDALLPMIEVLVASLEDEDIDVQKYALIGISDFKKNCTSSKHDTFTDLIEENYYQLIIELPRIIHSRDEKSTASALTLLSQYIKILGESHMLHQVLNSMEHLKKLLTVLSIAVELELTHEVTEKVLVADGDIPWKSYKIFRHYTDQSTSKKIDSICSSLSSYGDPETVIDYLTELYQHKAGNKKEVLYILNEVILGTNNLSENTINHILDVYLDVENLYLPLEVDESQRISIKESRSNIIEVMLLMEGIGKLASVVGSTFHDYILRTLYYVIEKVGSTYCAIRRAASISAMQISKVCGYGGGISKLIEANIDYLTYYLTLKLKKTDHNKGVFDVVSVVMESNPMTSISNIEDIINSVLKSSAERFESLDTLTYLRLFHTFVSCVLRWMGSDAKKSGRLEKDLKKDDKDDLVGYIEAKNKTPEEEEGTLDDGNIPQGDEQEEYPEEKKKELLPKHVDMTLTIGRHCLHFLPSKDRDKKLVVLEILSDSVNILANHENALLPFVHEIWSPLVTRFEKIVDPLVINRSFTLLCTLCDCSREFIRSRTLKEVLPTLATFLRKSAEESKMKDSGTGYFYTQTFKLQRSLLSALGRMAVDLKLFEKQVDCIVNSALPYLSKNQPKELQMCSAKLLKDLESLDPYVVALYLQHSTAEKALEIYRDYCSEEKCETFVLR